MVECCEGLTDTGLNVLQLEAVALTHFCLSETANWLDKIYIQQTDADPDALTELLSALKEMCTGEQLSWPRYVEINYHKLSIGTALSSYTC